MIWPGWDHFLLSCVLWITVPFVLGWLLAFYVHLFWRGVKFGWRMS